MVRAHANAAIVVSGKGDPVTGGADALEETLTAESGV